MPRFKSSADILKIVSNKDQIRNMGIIAHVDHGKCVTGDSLVTLSDGRIEEIGHVYNRLRASGPSKIQVDSLDPTNLKMEDRSASHVWKLHGNKLVKITLRNGYSIETTPEHPFYVIGQDGVVAQKRADGIGKHDFVLVPNVLKSQAANLREIKSEILGTLSTHGYYIAYLDREFSLVLQNIIRKRGVRRVHSQLKTGSSLVALSGAIGQGRVRLDDLVGITDSMGIGREQVYDHIENIAYRLSRTRSGRLSSLITLPRTSRHFKDLAYLLGVLWGDGSDRAGFNNGYRPLLKTVSTIFRSVFGVSTVLVKDQRRSTYRLDHHGGLSLIRLLEDVFEYPSKHKARSIIFPRLILKMGNEYVAKLLGGEFDTDGGVERTSAIVSLTTASQKFAKQVSIALLRFSIIPTIRRKGQYYTLSVAGEDTRRFEKSVGFTIPRKRAALRTLARRAVSNRKTGIVPVSGRTLQETRTHLGISFHYMESKVPYYRSYESGRQSLTRPVFQQILNAFEKFSTTRSGPPPATKLVGEWNPMTLGCVTPSMRLSFGHLRKALSVPRA